MVRILEFAFLLLILLTVIHWWKEGSVFVAAIVTIAALGVLYAMDHRRS